MIDDDPRRPGPSGSVNTTKVGRQVAADGTVIVTEHRGDRAITHTWGPDGRLVARIEGRKPTTTAKEI